LHDDDAALLSRSRRLADQRSASVRHQTVRVVSRDDLLVQGGVDAVEADDNDAAMSSLDEVIDAEGIVLDATAGVGLIGRRADGSLVSKHDARLDARLKAQSLHDHFDSAGDIAEARVPGRVYNELLRKQDRTNQHQAAVSLSAERRKLKQAPKPRDARRAEIAADDASGPAAAAEATLGETTTKL